MVQKLYVLSIIKIDNIIKWKITLFKLNNENENNEDNDNTITLLFKQNNILITSFLTEFNYFYEKFINKFDSKKKDDCFTLFDCNGCAIIIKNDNCLTFNTSIYAGECYGETDFTVLITDEIFSMIEKVKTIKQNFK
jgi:hypothetical protein